MAAKKSSKEQSKADFIRSLPVSMPALEVVEKGKAAGMKFITAYVYNVRSGARAGVVSRTSAITRAGNTPVAKKILASTATKQAATNGLASASKETSFRRLALDLGLERAKDLLAEMERAIEAVVGSLRVVRRPSRRAELSRKLE
jgi:hypothetical protein